MARKNLQEKTDPGVEPASLQATYKAARQYVRLAWHLPQALATGDQVHYLPTNEAWDGLFDLVHEITQSGAENNLQRALRAAHLAWEMAFKNQNPDKLLPPDHPGPDTHLMSGCPIRLYVYHVEEPGTFVCDSAYDFELLDPVGCYLRDLRQLLRNGLDGEARRVWDLGECLEQGLCPLSTRMHRTLGRPKCPTKNNRGAMSVLEGLLGRFRMPPGFSSSDRERQPGQADLGAAPPGFQPGDLAPAKKWIGQLLASWNEVHLPEPIPKELLDAAGKTLTACAAKLLVELCDTALTRQLEKLDDPQAGRTWRFEDETHTIWRGRQPYLFADELLYFFAKGVYEHGRTHFVTTSELKQRCPHLQSVDRFTPYRKRLLRKIPGCINEKPNRKGYKWTGGD